LYRRTLADYRNVNGIHPVLTGGIAFTPLKKYDDTIVTRWRRTARKWLSSGAAGPLRACRHSPIGGDRISCDPADVATWDHSGAPRRGQSGFVVAFPLPHHILELTLDAHPLLQSMDEQPFVQNALEDIWRKGSPTGAPRPAHAADLH